MDVNLSYSVSNEDLVGILRTIWLFLESINFKTTSSALQEECSSKGYSNVNSAPAKVLLVTPSKHQKTSDHLHYNVQQIHHGNQTEYSETIVKNQVLENSNHNEPLQKDDSISEPVYVYYTDVANFSNKIVSHSDVDSNHKHAKIFNSINLTNVMNLCTDENANSAESSLENSGNLNVESIEHQNEKTNQKRKKAFKRSPNTIESEIPTKILSKTSLFKESSKQNLRKSHSNPSLAKEFKIPAAKSKHSKSGNSKSTITSEQDVDKVDNNELKKRFHQLQKDHQKLMSVTAELTTALQTHIMGQSENLNNILNNCRNIYPDLFTTGSQQSSFKRVEESTSKLMSATPVVPHEQPSFQIVSDCAVQQVVSTNRNSVKISNRIIRSSTPVKNKKFDKQLSLSAPNSSSERKFAASEDQNVRINFAEEIRQNVNTKTTADENAPKDTPSKITPSQDLSSNTLNHVHPILSGTNNVCSIQSEIRVPSERKICIGINVSEDDIASEQKFDKNLHETDAEEEKDIRKLLIDITQAPELSLKHSSSVILVANDEPNKQKEVFKELPINVGDDFFSLEKSPSNIVSQREEKLEQIRSEQKIADNIEADVYTIEKPLELHYQVFHDTPEIYVTTENLAKLKEVSTLKSPRHSESDYSSPRDVYFDLDFKKLKKSLLSDNDDVKLGILQALRWRITQSDSDVRDHIISSYVRNDLLGLHTAPNTNGKSIVELYYTPTQETPHPLQEGMARLVNTFASLTLGRDYLCQDDDLLASLLLPLIMGTHHTKAKIDDVTRDMLIATLQKLSLRNRQRLHMISAGLVEHLLTFLATKHSILSAYCMEYTTALLMNLCLHKEARERLHPVAVDVVSLLADLLCTRHQCCMPYVNGTMYSLLGDSYINQEAKRLNLAKLIEYHMKRTTGEMRRQLQYILKLHLEGPGETDCGCDSNVETENEVDLLESELDNGDSYNKQPSGETLLENYKLLFSLYGSQVYTTHLKCLCHAITPIPRYPQAENVKENETVPDEDMPKIPANCTCEKSTQSENKNTVSSSNAAKLEVPQLSHGKNRRSSVQTKRGSSEPSTTLKRNNEVTENVTASEKTSRVNSPDLSFSEETQQFYYTPSAKTGIFENNKVKKLHRVPPSFTRTIPLATRIEQPPMICFNPECSYTCGQPRPIFPKQNSTIRNPPYALDYVDCVPSCYRETYKNQPNFSFNNDSECNCYKCKNICPNCNKRNKYACNCYNVIKGLISDTNSETRNNYNRETNDSAIKTCECNSTPHQTLCYNCQNSQSSPAQGRTIHLK